MKKILLTMSAAVLLGTATTAQTKKVMIEDFTGHWCGWCPEGTVILEGLKASNPTNLITVATHAANNDPLIVPDGTAIVSMLKQIYYPGGAVDRTYFAGEAKVPVSRGKWSPYFSQRAAVPAIVSVGFSNKKYVPATEEFEADVNIEFTSAPTAGMPVVYQVYVLEDSIPATGAATQQNYSSNIQGGAKTLSNWYHNYTLRDGLATNPQGDPITTGGDVAVNTKYTKHIKFKPAAGWDKDMLHLVAFVSYNGGDTMKKSILNAEEVKNIGKTFWATGIEETLQSNVAVERISPNPAVLNEIVKIQYYTSHTTKVSMKVYNAIGQLVAEPYNSLEVEGSHTIDWKPIENSLTPGFYLVEVSTQYGKHVQRISLR